MRISKAPSAEELAFNSQGARQKCGGTGSVRTVDMASLVPDDSLTIDGGAVAPWNSLMWSLMTDVCREMGVRTDVPFRDLTEQEKDIVYHGPQRKSISSTTQRTRTRPAELDFTYYNAVYTVENALAKVKDDKGMKRVEKPCGKMSAPEVTAHGFSGGACAEAAGHLAGRSLPDDAGSPRGVGEGRAGQPAGRDAPDGGEHLRGIRKYRQTADGLRSGLSDA